MYSRITSTAPITKYSCLNKQPHQFLAIRAAPQPTRPESHPGKHVKSFARRIIDWQQVHGRHDLPWQGADAYRVWLSEIMLQQTQVTTVIPYYQRFVESFKDIATLAAASEDEVLSHWSGLGYYSRARNLHRAAKLVVQQYKGKFPGDFEAMLALPGIGRSTAAAISALAFHQRRAILDGNVKRVLARYCGIAGYPGDRKIEAQLWQQAETLLPALSPIPSGEKVRVRGGAESPIALYTQGLMDLGATICTRTKPKCTDCPVRKDCKAYLDDLVATLPTPRPRKVLPEKQCTMLLLMHGTDILLEKRPGNGIWGGLWCLPQFEDETSAMHWGAQRGIGLRGRSTNATSKFEELPVVTHTFTHFKLHIAPLRVRLSGKPNQVQEPGMVWLDSEDALNAAVPAPVRRILVEISGRSPKNSR